MQFSRSLCPVGRACARLASVALAAALLCGSSAALAADETGNLADPSSAGAEGSRKSPQPSQPTPGQPDPSQAAPVQQEPQYSEYYTGAFVEYSVRGGASLASEASYDGWHIDAGVRHSFPMLLGDFRVAYRFDNLSENDPGASDALTSGPIEQHSLGGYLALHPAYLLMLGSDWLSYTLASIHLELGGGARLGVLERTADGEFEMGVGPFVSIGGGFDMPLADPDSGAAPWLNVVYRWHVADFDGDVETYDIDMHVVQVGLGWRINGLMF